jgi:ATP-binding cassette subfamily C protein CydD
MKLRQRLSKELSFVRLPFGLIVALGFASGLVTIAWAYSLTQVVERVFLQQQDLAAVQGWLWVMLALALLRFGVVWGGEVISHLTAQSLKTQMRERLLAHLLTLSPYQLAQERSGELVNTLMDGVEALDAYFRQYLPQMLLMLLVPVAILLIIFPLDTLSGVVLLLTAPLLPFFMALIGKWAGAVSQGQFQVMSYLSAHFLDVMQGLSTLKLFNRSQVQVKKIRQFSDEFRLATMRVLRVAFLSSLSLELLTTLSVAIIAVEIGLRLLYDHISFEQAFFVLVLAPEFYQPLRNFGASFHASASGLAAAERIYALLDQPSSISPAAREVPTPLAELRFEAVSYTYPGRTQPALAEVSFQVQAGQTVAIVGQSGSGKSTLAGLLLRFLEPSQGQILVNNVPLGQLSPELWREHIAWVSQQPYLFHGSLLANLRLVCPSASLDELWWAAEQADLMRFIQSLPQGWETPIGERGLRLSGGQAQRVAVARAFLKKAPLLLWDEATAHLDQATEERVLQGLERLSQGRTTLMITHHTQTLAHADYTLTLVEGHLLE